MEPFSFNSWYKRLHRLTIKSVIIPLTSQDVQFLEDPASFVHLGDLPNIFQSIQSNSDDDEAENDANILGLKDWNLNYENNPSSCDQEDKDADNSSETSTSEEFNIQCQVHKATYISLSKRISSAMKRLGEKTLFPKLNFSAPIDAWWMSPTRTLECASADDVLLLLKSSDCIAFDLSVPLSIQCPRVLVLRPWCSFILPSHEFRVWVDIKKKCAACGRDGSKYCVQLIGVSQRDCANFYEFLVSPVQKAAILEVLARFMFMEVSPRLCSQKVDTENKHLYANGCKLAIDVFFMILPTDAFCDSPLIIDLNPALLNCTDTLLFSRNELQNSYDACCCKPDKDGLESCSCTASWQNINNMRVVEDVYSTTATSGPKYASSSMPYDFVKMSHGREILDFGKEWQRAIHEASYTEKKKKT